MLMIPVSYKMLGKILFLLVYWTSSHYIYIQDVRPTTSKLSQRSKRNLQNWVGHRWNCLAVVQSRWRGTPKSLTLLPCRQSIQKQPGLWALWRPDTSLGLGFLTCDMGKKWKLFVSLGVAKLKCNDQQCVTRIKHSDNVAFIAVIVSVVILIFVAT